MPGKKTPPTKVVENNMKSQSYINASVTDKDTYPTPFAAQVEKEALKAAKVYYDLFFETQSGTTPQPETPGGGGDGGGADEAEDDQAPPPRPLPTDDDYMRRGSSIMVPLLMEQYHRPSSPLAAGGSTSFGSSSTTHYRHYHSQHNNNNNSANAGSHHFGANHPSPSQQDDAVSNNSFPSMSSLTASVHHVPRNRVVNTPFHTFFPPVLKWSDRRRIIQTIVGGPSRPFHQWKWNKSADFEEILRGHDAFLKTVADREEGALPAIGAAGDTNNNTNNNNNIGAAPSGVRRLSAGPAITGATLRSGQTPAAGGSRMLIPSGPLLVPRERSESAAGAGSFQSQDSRSHPASMTTPSHPPPSSASRNNSNPHPNHHNTTSPLLKPVPPSISTTTTNSSAASTPRGGMGSTAGSSPSRGLRSRHYLLHHANSTLLPGETTSPAVPPSHPRRQHHQPRPQLVLPMAVERAASTEPSLAESAPAFVSTTTTSNTTTQHRHQSSHRQATSANFASDTASPTLEPMVPTQNASSLPLPGRMGGGYGDDYHNMNNVNNSFCYSFPASHQGPEYFTMASEESTATRVVIVMVGLPARGKTFLAQKICRLLGWHGERGTVYNVQSAWRQAVIKAATNPTDTSSHHRSGNGQDSTPAPSSPSAHGWVRAEHFHQLLANPKSLERRKYNEVLDEFAVSCKEFFEDRGKVVILNDDFVTHDLRMEAERRFRHIGSHYFYIEMIRGSERNSLYNELKVQDAMEYPTQIERDTAREDFQKRLKILEDLYESLDEVHEHQYQKRASSMVATTTTNNNSTTASSHNNGGALLPPAPLPHRGGNGGPTPLSSSNNNNNNNNNPRQQFASSGINSLSSSLTVSPPLGTRAPQLRSSSGNSVGMGHGPNASGITPEPSFSDAAEREAQSYIMIRDTNTIEVHGVEGYLCSRIVSYLMNISQRKIQHPIYFVRHGESCYNLEDRIGGNPLLTAQGMRDSAALLEFLDSLKLQLHLEEKHHASTCHHRGRGSAAAANPNPNPPAGALQPDRGAHAAPSCSCAAASSHSGCCADGDDGETSQAGRLEIWTSQLQRAIQTAELSERLLNIKTLRWSSLNEIHAGVCEELTYAEVRERYQLIDHFRKEIKYTFRYPGGESYQDMVMRLEPVIMELENAEKVVVVVAHQAILRCLLAYFGSVSAESSIRVKVPHRVVWRCTYDSKGVARLDEIHLDNLEAGKFAGETVLAANGDGEVAAAA